MGQVKVDEYLKEQIEYREASFPFGIWLDDFQHLLSHTLDCHWHDSMEFGVVLEGEVEYYVNQYPPEEGRHYISEWEHPSHGQADRKPGENGCV